MKKLAALALILVMVLAMAACGGGGDASTAPPADSAPADDGGDAAPEETPEEPAEGDGQVFKVAFLVPFIGDQSYFDSVNNGRLIVEEYPNVETTLIEMTEDKSKWEGYYLDACESGFDLIVGGNMDAEEFLYGVAEQYPDQLFFNFDYVNHVELPNVYAVMYNTPELGYVAGTLASLVTTSDMENANEDKVIGAVVGMDNAYMNDFVGSYCQAAYENGVQVIIGYPESFTDAAKAKEITGNMYSQGADVVWQVAGGAGMGVFEAAAAQGRYSLGVDVDQVKTMSGQPEVAATILTSLTKNCDQAVVRAVDFLIAGSFPAGTSETLGLAEGGVGVAENEQYTTLVPQDIRDQVQATMDKVAAGEIEVISALFDDEAWQDIKAKATAAQ